VLTTCLSASSSSVVDLSGLKTCNQRRRTKPPVLIEASSAKIMETNQVHTGASFITRAIKSERPRILSGTTRINIFRCPMRSASLDQNGLAIEITMDATALSAPASA